MIVEKNNECRIILYIPGICNAGFGKHAIDGIATEYIYDLPIPAFLIIGLQYMYTARQ